MGRGDIIRVAFFYDGYFFYRLSNYFRNNHPVRRRINLRGFQNYILDAFAAHEKIPITNVRLVGAHYFWGRPKAKDERPENVSRRTRFEDALIMSGVTIHSNHLAAGEGGRLGEKGVDIALTVEALDSAFNDRFDAMVLVSGDGDFVPLLRRLAVFGIMTVVPTVDESYESPSGVVKVVKTSEQLQREAYLTIDISAEVRNKYKAQGDRIRMIFLWDDREDEDEAEAEEEEEVAAQGPSHPPAPALELFLAQDEWVLGVVKAVKENDAGPYGFIEPEERKDEIKEDVFFTEKSLAPGVDLRGLSGRHVRFKVRKNPHPRYEGRPMAVEVTPVD